MKPKSLLLWSFIVLTVLIVCVPTSAKAEQGTAHWIWSAGENPDQDLNRAKTCYFRQEIDLSRPLKVTIDITADDAYILYVNGDRIGEGSDWKYVKQFDVTQRIQRGKNVIAVEATNQQNGAAGLLVRMLVEQNGGTTRAFTSNDQWKATDQPQSNTAWTALNYNASAWKPVHVFGKYPDAEPWKTVSWASKIHERFQVADGFQIVRVAGPDVCGSVVNMGFDEQGRVITSRERGPLQLLVDKDGDGVADAVKDLNDKVKNCQGVFAFDGTLLAAGQGPDGTALYRMTDTDGDGVYEKTEAVQIYDAGIGDHGPHAIFLGPDGSLYNVMGNHVNIKGEVNPNSPHRDYYEGDLLPKYEDARGHARGKKAPAGIVYRLNQDGSDWRLVAGGFRNEFDMAFNADGELFTFDSDMEWDVGLPWYRPVRINHVVPGGEYGWRSGASKWPVYYFDSLPSTVDAGRGSPTGVCFYHHYTFPKKYHDAFFVADWSQGKILAVHHQREGASYKGDIEVFATGNPLNISDIVVGPNGDLYFCLGGRGTEGGVYRITPDQPLPAPQPHSDSTVDLAISLPQPSAAWTRAKIAKLRADAGSNWRPQLTRVADDERRSVADRRRAVGILKQFGDGPSRILLNNLAGSKSPELKVVALQLLAIDCDDQGQQLLISALGDEDPWVRRRACEALIRANLTAPVEVVLPLLADQDRFARYAARKLLERIPSSQWEAKILKTDDVRIAAAGLLALVTHSSSAEQNEAILKRTVALLRSEIADKDALDLLRVAELALLNGETSDSTRANLAHAALHRFPSTENSLNWELARVLAYLQESRAVPKLLSHLENTTERTDRLHIAYCLRFIPQGWNWDQQAKLLAAYNEGVTWEGGASFRGYIENMTRDYLASQGGVTKKHLLQNAATLSMPARLMLESFDDKQATAFSAELIDLDRQLAKDKSGDEANTSLAAAVIESLGRSHDESSQNYLRKVFAESPDRREGVAKALARRADAGSFQELAATLEFGDKSTLLECVRGLQKIDAKPEKPQTIRALIIVGLKLEKGGRSEAVKLLKKWTGQDLSGEKDSDDKKLVAYQNWFADSHPDLPPAELPKATKKSKWGYQQLLSFVTENEKGRAGNAERGAKIFEKGQCIKCHRFGKMGEGLGPDLTTVRKRFQRKQIIESLFYPSAVISDQYQSMSIITVDGLTMTGLAVEQGNAYVVLTTDGKKTTVKKQDIEEMIPSKTSGMPEGLLDELTLEEIADLFAYLDSAPQQSASGGQ